MLIKFKKIFVIFLLVLVIAILSSCSSNSKNNSGLPDDLEEDIINEDAINQIISQEIYLKEMLVVEDMVSELLIQEDRVEEVVSCKSIYISQENIEEFSNNSQTVELFGDDIQLATLLTKVAIGTGVIITLSVLKITKLDGLVGSVVASAAPAALKGAAIGTGVETLYGGLTGAIDKIDESGRTSAILGFSMSVVGFVGATITAVLAASTGGSTIAAVAFGVKIGIAGISLATSAMFGYNMVKKLTTTNSYEIDWNNIDWNKVGVSAAEQSLNNAADGYVWGSIIGAVKGGVEGYKKYEKYNTPYSSKIERLKQTPKDGNGGHWTGARGESTFILDEPVVCKSGVTVDRINYTNGVPDFSDYSLRQVSISSMTDNRNKNFSQADELLAEYWSSIKYNNRTWSARDISNFRSNNGYTWHEMNNMKTMQLVPTEVNGSFGHLGGVGEYNAMQAQKGGVDFD